MNIRSVLMLLLLAGVLSSQAIAQSSWIGNMPMQFNPSFAGTSDQHRISTLVPYRIFTNTEDGIRLIQELSVLVSHMITLFIR